MEDARTQLTAHAGDAHKDMMEKATPEDIAKWNENFEKNVWANTPDDK